MGSSDHNRRAALSRASRASGASGASRGPRFTRGSACRAIEALQHSAAALGFYALKSRRRGRALIRRQISRVWST